MLFPAGANQLRRAGVISFSPSLKSVGSNIYAARLKITSGDVHWKPLRTAKAMIRPTARVLYEMISPLTFVWDNDVMMRLSG